MTDVLEFEAQQEHNERIMLLWEIEQRFSVPGCPWECDDGWHHRPLADTDIIPNQHHIFYPWLLLTPCECNLNWVYRLGICYTWPCFYPAWYDGPQAGPPPRPTDAELRARIQQIQEADD